MSLIFSEDKLTVIAGPCMLESVQIAETVLVPMKALCDELNVNYIFKASFDKANRTSGSSFRGPGLKKGLAELSELKSKHKVKALTDIHSASQVEAVSEVVDILQIPAFLCEDRSLLLAAARSGLTIQVKKGQYIDPEGLLRVSDFLLSNGAKEVSLCERGSSFGYHNLIVDFRSLDVMRKNNAKVVFDATHAAQLPGGGDGVSSGTRAHIPALARAAAAVGVDGLFIEVHPNPAEALSDKDTQLTPQEAQTLLREFVALDACRRSLSSKPQILQADTPRTNHS